MREEHDFQRVQLHGGGRHKGQYFGPFASAGSVRETLNALQKLFLLRSCTDSFFANRSRPCLLFQIRRCSAPCVGRIDAAAYEELVQDAKDFLGGRSTMVQQKLGRQMSEAADAMDFELAAIYRDRLRALTFIQGSQAIHAEKIGDADLFALAARAGPCVSRPSSFAAVRIGGIAVLPRHTNEFAKRKCWPVLAQFYEETRHRGCYWSIARYRKPRCSKKPFRKRSGDAWSSRRRSAATRHG